MDRVSWPPIFVVVVAAEFGGSHQNGSVTTSTADAAYEGLRTVLSAGSVDGLIDIRQVEDSALLMLGWPPLEDLFGVELSLVSPDDWLDVADPTADLDEWIATLGSSLAEEIDTGLLYRGRRRQGDGYIELHGPDWPSDDRFYGRSGSRPRVYAAVDPEQ